MLSGVGGRTIEEAQSTLSYSEAQIWQAYIQKRGSLHTGRRIEQSVGHLSFLFAQANFKGRQKLESYMPHEAPEPQELTMDYLMGAYGGKDGK